MQLPNTNIDYGISYPCSILFNMCSVINRLSLKMLPKVVFIVILTDACSSSIQPPSPSPAKPGPKVCPLAWAQYEDRCYWLIEKTLGWVQDRLVKCGMELSWLQFIPMEKEHS